LALAYELTANATKYGALSNESGVIRNARTMTDNDSSGYTFPLAQERLAPTVGQTIGSVESSGLVDGCGNAERNNCSNLLLSRCKLPTSLKQKQ
jgi:hypothetical protein